MTPELAAAFLRAFARIREEMSEAALARAIALGFADRIVEQMLTQTILDVAFAPVRQQLRETLRIAVPYYARTMPPKVVREVSIAFDVLSPHVQQGIRTLESRVITTLQGEVRETVREAVAKGLVEARSHRVAAKNIRASVGLAPSQLHEVDLFREKLQHAHERTDWLDNKLRDKRFDAALRKARNSGVPLTTERIDAMTDAYRKRRIAQHASTVSGTAAKDAQRLANRLSWENLVEQGGVDRNALTKTWRGIMDTRERETHRKMEGVTVGFDQPWILPDGQQQMIPGSGDYNCRCIAIYRVKT
jgi:uncharacterized protein with gpF-like domain